MTTKTEQSKRDMYESLDVLKHVYRANPKPLLFGYFDTALEQYLEALRQEQDDLRNWRQALEFANRAAGDELRAAHELIRRQREVIRTLYTSRKARKPRTLAQIRANKGNASESICGPLPEYSLTVCQHLWMKRIDYPSGALTSQCIYCMKIQEC